MTTPILPGSTVGLFGGGQLGRMFAIAARKMGYRVHTFSPDSDLPANQLADVEVVASFNDLDAVRVFARNVDVITMEFENVSSKALRVAEELKPVRPASQVLRTTQHRVREKTFLRESGFPVTPFVQVRKREDLDAGVKAFGYPSVLKLASFGYDGKGQWKISMPSDVEPAFHSLGGQNSVLEKFVKFEKEISVVAARGVDGDFRAYDILENCHQHKILHTSFAPAAISEALARKAVEITRGVFEKLDVIGVMCVEFFVTKDGDLLVNELAPRPHNSGHLTFDAAVTSQFEQQLRAVCGLPLGETRLYRPAAMINILGDAWKNGTPNWPAALAHRSVKLHLYGKDEPRPGRKMGHLTATGDTPQEAMKLVTEAFESL
ncbi:MAG TPA: 5-(carboxyamino)imidazole ribonucleotide synthase [Thermoanaerobaculia bacterium]|nr:5-(carboxyamino)imidazole ribonucleotide synthase [Thermoanaerobaculia bacterium]